ncbi:hypothetical protein [Roseibium sp. RKSG952]|uniref:hypothetical protein n=1 Tax=Roseibium sp. RKSG952 TaxID=2529384 RepID=UPI0012BD5795|nr:hypothetical protein [Roseibium sp. RKSG952]MTH94743.1 hypothetical protein [Roseibium sp. RKSG952]
MRNISGDEFQPLDGLAFSTPGHYGSTFFDPCDGTSIEIAVCDDCLKGLAENSEYVCRLNPSVMRESATMKEDIDDMIDERNETEAHTRENLSQFLGITGEEFEVLVKDGKLPNRIVDRMELDRNARDPLFGRLAGLMREMPSEAELDSLAEDLGERLKARLGTDFEPFLGLLKATASAIHEKTRRGVSGNNLRKARKDCIEANLISGLMSDFLKKMMVARN